MTMVRAHEGPDIRENILQLLKTDRSATINELASKLNITYEAVRQHVVQMEREGWLERRIQRIGVRRVGRPTASYSLTSSGDHLFPKAYDTLASELLESVGGTLGGAALQTVLRKLSDSHVATLEPFVRGRTLRQQLKSLRGYYSSNDPFMELREREDGNFELIERNCPFLNVATDHPEICGTTITALERLLGHRVRREESFQDGHRRCVFVVHIAEPIQADPKSL